MNIKDISDVVCPWNEIVIKDEIIELADEDNNESANISEYHENQTLVTTLDENHLKSVADQLHENEKTQVTNAIINTDELDFKCENCSASFNSLKHLKIHIHFLHEKTGKKEDCETCGISFKTQRKAMLHFEETHLGIKKEKLSEKIMACEICGKTYKKKQSLLSHIKLIHVYDERLHSHKCDVCGKIYKSKEFLREHISVIHEGKRYECKSCKSI